MLSKEIIFIDYRELNVYLRILPPPPKSILPPPENPSGGGAKIARAQIVAAPGIWSLAAPAKKPT